MAKVYSLGVVGESNYQREIAKCSAGERVFICHEPDNPYDSRALKVETSDGDTIGYVPKSSWLRDAIHEQGRGVTATIASIADGGKGLAGVVLSVTLSDDEVSHRSYGVSESRSSWLSRLFK